MLEEVLKRFPEWEVDTLRRACSAPTSTVRGWETLPPQLSRRHVMGLLDGKVAVITGAGSGMAKASTKLFVAEGAKVVAADISGAEKDTAAEVGAGVLPVHCDVTQEDDVAALFEAAVDGVRPGRRGARTWPASGSRRRSHKFDMDDYDKVMDVDLRGVFLGMKHGIPPDARRGRRRDRELVVGRWAQRSEVGMPTSVYNAAKAASIADQVGVVGVRPSRASA